MKKLAIFAFFLINLEFFGSAVAAGLSEVLLEEVSTSGKSLALDRGTLEDFEIGMYARFFVQKGPKESPVIFLVAEGELVKSFPRKSYWLLKKVHLPDVVKNSKKLLILTSRDVTVGRPLKLRAQHVVIPTDDLQELEDFLDKNQDNVPQRFIKEEMAYEKSADIFEKGETRDATPEADVVVRTYESFKKKGGNYISEEYGDLSVQKYFIGNKEVYLGDIKKAEDKKLFDSMSDGYVSKTNSMKYGLKDFYRETKKANGQREVNAKGTIASTYDTIKENKKIADQISPRIEAKYARDGELWSADMDDENLRRYFIKTGLEKEIRRRDLALNELEGHEVMLQISGSVAAHGNQEDPNYQGRGYNLGIGYDLHLSRTSKELKKWSLQFMLETGTTEYDTGVFNARSEEVLYGAYLNYYFINNPLTLNSFIYLVGVGIKNGSASVFSPDLSKEYSYQLLTLPALQLMTKYRFRSGDLTEDTVNIGLSWNFAINLDMKKLSVIDRLDDDINSKISVNDLKYSLGMSLYF